MAKSLSMGFVITGLVALAPIAGAIGDTSWQAKLARVVPISKRMNYSWGSTVRPVTLVRGKLKTSNADPTAYVFENGSFRALTPTEADMWAKQRREKDAAIGKALGLIRKDDLRPARDILEPLVKEDGTDEYAVVTLARASLRQGRFEEALTLLTPLIHDRAGEETLLFAAYAGVMMGRFFEGEQDFANRIVMQSTGGILGTEPSIPRGAGAAGVQQSVLLALACWYSMAGDDAEAGTYLSRFIALQPRNAWANYLLGGVLQRKGVWLAASKAFAIAASSSAGKLQELAAQDRDYAAARAKQG